MCECLPLPPTPTIQDDEAPLPWLGGRGSLRSCCTEADRASIAARMAVAAGAGLELPQPAAVPRPDP